MAQEQQLPRVREIERRLREEIESGARPTGSRLPTRAEMSDTEGVSERTVSLAIRRLREAGYVTSDPSGVYVAEEGPHTVATGQERAARAMSTGRMYPAGERARILFAGTVPAPEEVAHALGLPDGAVAVRRERVTERIVPEGEAQPVTWSVSWLAGTLADVAPELVRAERIPGGTVGLVAQRTGRLVTIAADRIHARGAVESEATALGIPAGLPVLVGRTTWSDADGTVVEHGEWVIPPGREVHYSYDIGAE